MTKVLVKILNMMVLNMTSDPLLLYDKGARYNFKYDGAHYN